MPLIRAAGYYPKHVSDEYIEEDLVKKRKQRKKD
jgi:hypothetical protein